MSDDSSSHLFALINSMDQVYDDYRSDPGLLHMKNIYTNFVPGTKNLYADVVIVGEAPGKVENAKKMPFMGPAGKLLEEMITEAKLTSIYLTNVVKYWPTDENAQTRKPTDKEIKASIPHLMNELEIIEPKAIITVGAVATRALWPKMDKNISNLVGERIVMDNCILLPMLHPAYILRNLPMLDQYKKDWRALGETVKRHI